jgi:hypothetical protein
MGRRDKLITRLKSRPRDLRGKSWCGCSKGWATLRRQQARLADHVGVSLTRPHRRSCCEKPHPGNIVKMYVIDDVLRVLSEEGLL